MQTNSKIESRKAEHLTINLEKDVQSGLQNGLEVYQLIHHALPELDLADIRCETTIFERELAIPLLISSMTGGTEQAANLNKRLAAAAQTYGLAMGVGSQRVGLEHPELMHTFKVRDLAPDILLFANLGAIQLNNNYTIEHCKAAIDTLEADALILHLNPLQEALMKNGDTNFSGLLMKIEQVCRQLPVPVIVKEVGWGITEADAKSLVSAGVQAIDVAGAGGTSWSEVEKHRRSEKSAREIAGAFRHWGMPTAKALVDIREVLPDILLFASGGIKDGVEMAKCLALGANLVGMAGIFLKAASDSEQELHRVIEVITQQLRISMFAAGAGNLGELNHQKIFKLEG